MKTVEITQIEGQDAVLVNRGHKYQIKFVEYSINQLIDSIEVWGRDIEEAQVKGHAYYQTTLPHFAKVHMLIKELRSEA